MAKAVLYCEACGMPQYQVLVIECPQCGAARFTSEPSPASWDFAITHNDKKFLKSIKVQVDT